MQFFRMSITNRKAAVCLSAFLFGPAYLFYRKMWKQGLLATLVMVVLSIPGFMSIIATFNPAFFGSLPLGWLPAAYTIGEIGIWAIKVILGMFAVSWYHDSSKAQIEGYRIGGKTATSEKYPRGTGKYISSFLGFAPANDPQVMAFVLIDDPTGVYYGGRIAAPVIQEVFSNILPYLLIPKEE